MSSTLEDMDFSLPHIARSRVARIARWVRAVKLRRLPRRILEVDPNAVTETHSARRVNKLATGLGQAERYLEVGVQEGRTLEGVRIAHRVAVDPNPSFDEQRLPAGVVVRRQTSDAFFESLPAGDRFDVVFLDGLHEWFQTYKDALNACQHLSPGGVILMDDVLPCDAVSAMPSLEDSYRVRKLMGSSDRRWHGDVYKTLFALYDHHKDIAFRVIDGGEGNPQAILWKTASSDALRLLPVAKPSDYASLTYELAFGHGSAPDFFSVGGEDDVILHALRQQRT